MNQLDGKDFIALARLSNGADQTIAECGGTCERVPAGKHGGTVSDSLRDLINAGILAPAKLPATMTTEAFAKVSRDIERTMLTRAQFGMAVPASITALRDALSRVVVVDAAPIASLPVAPADPPAIEEEGDR